MSPDRIPAERRSYRQFRPELPPEDPIRRIIAAGLPAPFAAAAEGNSMDYFRRFFVMRMGSRSMKATAPLVMEQVGVLAGEVKKEMEMNPALGKSAGSFTQRLDAIRKMGRVPGIGTAPYYLIVAERRRVSSCRVAVTSRTAWRAYAESNCTRVRVPARPGHIEDVSEPGIL